MLLVVTDLSNGKAASYVKILQGASVPEMWRGGEACRVPVPFRLTCRKPSREFDAIPHVRIRRMLEDMFPHPSERAMSLVSIVVAAMRNVMSAMEKPDDHDHIERVYLCGNHIPVCCINLVDNEEDNINSLDRFLVSHCESLAPR